MAALLEARGITKMFGGLAALRDVDLSIEEGDIHPNDAGYQVIAETILEALGSP